ncbi:cell cycle checkpoint control protein RAD9B-like [Oppia nitens]|uniref:cell cycle checkpoint control protein RAD9B-like n=1 Tax=Oppia nitens TaxID=1686743 RepID=UPI0023DAAF72|nr:cell cycle checkpoint control protein RAD9B-like [Oppia nitens]
MKCKIVGQNLRVFSKAVRLFCRLSDEVLICVDTNSMRLQCINSLKTGFIELHFERSFFATFESNCETKCKLFLKSMMLVFRVVNIDKSVDSCTIIMDESMPRVVFEMKCPNAITREYFVPYMESTVLHYNSRIATPDPTFKVQSKQLSECLHNFSNDTKDITLWLTSQQILFKNYYDDVDEHSLMTSFAYSAREFHNYNFIEEITVTFDVKDLKAFIEFTLFRDQRIDCYFEATGKPIEFRTHSDNYFSAKLILATHDFPESQCPNPPTPALNQTSNQSFNLSLSNRNNNQSTTVVGNNTNTIASHQTATDSNDHNNSETINSNSGVNNDQQIINTGDDDDDDENGFDENDDDVIEQLISQLESVTQSGEAFNLSGDALRQYHKSVIHPQLDDDECTQSTTQWDVLVSESEDEC